MLGGFTLGVNKNARIVYKMARKSRVRRQIKSRRTQRRRLLVGGKTPIANVQFNEKAESLSKNPFNMVLEFNNGYVKYGDVKIGIYKDNMPERYYMVEPFVPNVNLYGRPLTEEEVEKHEKKQIKVKPVVKKSSSYYGILSSLVTPRSSVENDKKTPYSTFSSSD